MSVTLEQETVEKLALPVSADDDPTGTPPAFAFTQDPARPSTWVPGEWESATQAITPTIGGTDTTATVKLAVGLWRPWVRITVGSEVIVRKLPRIGIDPS